MPLSSHDRNLIVSVLRFARANGWTPVKRKHAFELEHPKLGSVDLHEPHEPMAQRQMTAYYWTPDSGQFVVQLWPSSIAQGIDLLVVIGLLPIIFSSQYRAGNDVAQEATTMAYKAGLAAGEESCRRWWAERITGMYYGIRTPGKLSVRQHNEQYARHLVKQFAGELELVSRPVIRWEKVPDA